MRSLTRNNTLRQSSSGTSSTGGQWVFSSEGRTMNQDPSGRSPDRTAARTNSSTRTGPCAPGRHPQQIVLMPMASARPSLAERHQHRPRSTQLDMKKPGRTSSDAAEQHRNGSAATPRRFWARPARGLEQRMSVNSGPSRRSRKLRRGFRASTCRPSYGTAPGRGTDALLDRARKVLRFFGVASPTAFEATWLRPRAPLQTESGLHRSQPEHSTLVAPCRAVLPEPRCNRGVQRVPSAKGGNNGSRHSPRCPMRAGFEGRLSSAGRGWRSACLCATGAGDTSLRSHLVG